MRTTILSFYKLVTTFESEFFRSKLILSCLKPSYSTEHHGLQFWLLLFRMEGLDVYMNDICKFFKFVGEKHTVLPVKKKKTHIQSRNLQSCGAKFDRKLFVQAVAHR